MKSRAKKLVLTALFIAIGNILPIFTMQLPGIGNMLLPMHIPILICGFICGWNYGLLAGFITPLLRSIIFGMPPLIPTACAMAFELAAYGMITGLLYKLLPKKNIFIYIDLICAMIIGRCIWGIVSIVLYGMSENKFTWGIFMTQGFMLRPP
jgi:riboflavin transporter FmnP